MKVLSLKQPFAELVVSGRKTIELRKWNTKFRGEFLIHASKNPEVNAMEQFGFEEGSLPLGFIIGRVRLVDVKNYSKTNDFDRDKDKHLASEEWGDYGFILENAERINPKEAKGKIGFWDFN